MSEKRGPGVGDAGTRNDDVDGGNVRTVQNRRHSDKIDNGSGVLRRVLEQACEEHGSNLVDLTVLSATIDPYRIDTAAGHRDGAWLAKQLERTYGQTKRAHWRGLHYAMAMAEHGEIRKPDGTIYRNIDEDWEWLIAAPAKASRWLGYIGFERIIDQRNSPPIIHRKSKTVPFAWLSIGLSVEIPDASDLDPVPYATGFDVREAFHFVIFGEKSSLEDVLLPIAVTYEADLYLPTGEISDTLLYQIAKDAAEDGRPMVMFTASDSDPSGYQMPVSIARKLQAFRDFLFHDLRFEVVPVALLPEQVRTIRPRLPETPLKKGEKRASRWVEAFGVDQTEIDVLTTPTKSHILREMFEQAFEPYIDKTLYARVQKARREWNAAAREVVDERIDADMLDEIRAEAAERLEELRAEIDKINEKVQLASDRFSLPPIRVPEAEVDLDPSRQALVLFDDDWVKATRALIARKSYGREHSE